jgi:hypothetical protein
MHALYVKKSELERSTMTSFFKSKFKVVSGSEELVFITNSQNEERLATSREREMIAHNYSHFHLFNFTPRQLTLHNNRADAKYIQEKGYFNVQDLVRIFAQYEIGLNGHNYCDERGSKVLFSTRPRPAPQPTSSSASTQPASIQEENHIAQIQEEDAPMEEDTDSDEENGAAEIPHEMQLPHQQPQQ